MAFTMRAPIVGTPLRARAPRCARMQRAAASATSRVDKCDKNSIIVAPSILSANFAMLGDQARTAGPCRPLSLRGPAPR